MHITLIAGARPNFMKIAALVHAIVRYNEGLRVTGYGLPVEYRLVHTGQHYDKNMSDTFFEELGIPAPDVNLGCDELGIALPNGMTTSYSGLSRASLRFPSSIALKTAV